jgi:hypothetical protein
MVSGGRFFVGARSSRTFLRPPKRASRRRETGIHPRIKCEDRLFPEHGLAEFGRDLIQINAGLPVLGEKGGMDTVLNNSGASADAPLCPSCGRPMRFVRAVPRFAALPELRTFECKSCAVTYTEAAEPSGEAEEAQEEAYRSRGSLTPR